MWVFFNNIFLLVGILDQVRNVKVKTLEVFSKDKNFIFIELNWQASFELTAKITGSKCRTTNFSEAKIVEQKTVQKLLEEQMRN